jgi:hypothetical protein
MMRSKILLATAAIALIAGTSGALAQQEPPRGAPAEKIAPKAPAGGVNSGAPARPGAAQNGGATHNGAAEERGERPNRSEAQPNRDRGETTGQAPQNERRDQGNERRDNQANEEKKGDRQPAANRKADQDRTTIDRNRATEQRGGVRDDDRNRATEERGRGRDNDRSPTTTGQGAAPSKGSANVTVNLTPEKRTRIHEVFIKERRAPRVERVDFDLAVGAAVPRSVRIVAVPRDIIEIEPEWRGYEYFMVGDQIVIVNPRSMEIVAVLDA